MVMSSRPLAPQHRARSAPASAIGAGPVQTSANKHDAANDTRKRGKRDEAHSSSSPPPQQQSPPLPPCRRRWRRGLGRGTLIATVAGAVFAIGQVAIPISYRRVGGGGGGFGGDDGGGARMIGISSPSSPANEGDDQSLESLHKSPSPHRHEHGPATRSSGSRNVHVETGAPPRPNVVSPNAISVGDGDTGGFRKDSTMTSMGGGGGDDLALTPLRSDADVTVEGGAASATAGRTTGDGGGYGAAAEDLGRLLSSPDGAVRGNPTVNPACRDALLLAHGLDAEDLAREFHSEYAVGGRRGGGEPKKKPGNLPPSFYSREALSAMLADEGEGRHDLKLRGIVRTNWNVRGGGGRRRGSKNFTKAAYIHLVKCGSSSIALMLKQGPKESSHRERRPFHPMAHMNEPSSDGDDHLAFRGDCTFTFVRDPLHRLVSAYYTIHHMMSAHAGKGVFFEDQLDAVGRRWAFPNVTSEPDRFRTFVREFTTSGRSHEFVKLHPLQHVYTMAGQMSPWYGSDVHFIGRVERFEEHWDLLSRGEGPCRGAVPERAVGDGTMPHAMDAREAFRVLRPDLVKALGLDEPEARAAARGRGSKLALPPYREITRNQSLFNDIVEHYWQDYVCFGYDLNYTDLGIHYTGEFRKPY